MILKQGDLKSYASEKKEILCPSEKKLGKLPEETRTSATMRLFKENIKDVYYKR